MMGSEIALDLKLCAVKSVNGFLRDTTTAAAGDRFSRLDDCVHRLEEEKGKIEAFKRELPLSVLLISQVITALREEQDQCRKGDRCKESIVPLKGKFEEDRGANLENDNKMSWMSSAQLWSDNNFTDDNIKPKKVDDRQESKSLCFESKPKSGAFVSFEKEETAGLVIPDLSLVSPAMKSSRVVPDVHEDNRSAVSAAKAGSRTSAGNHLSLQGQQQPPRKARRCWSPELHRRFVVALQQLGGPQVATPKQIRELMKVDGLTNDEVKSHLQKFRLHHRRSPNSSAATENKPVVWVGGLWVPQDHFPASSQQSASQTGSPEGPLQLAGSVGAVSLTAGDSYEEEDGKSESYSWK